MKKRIALNVIILLATCVIYNLIEYVLNIYNMAFMHKVFYPYMAIVAALSFLLILQIIHLLYCVTKNKKFRLLIRVISGTGTAIVSLILMLSLLFAPFLYVFSHQPEHIVEKDGKKMVAYVDSYLQITIYYYDYKTPFIRGKQLKIMVDGGNGGSDPYEDGGQGPHVYRYVYYDDDGNILDSNWAGE